MKNSIFYIFISILISMAVYFPLLSFHIFTYSDWVFYFSKTLKELGEFSVWNSFFNFGSIDFLFWNWPLHVLFSLIGSFGYDFNIVDKLLIFWPMIFALPIGSYFLVKKIIHSNIGAFIGSLILSYNTYFLSINTQGHELLTLGFVLSIFALIFFIKIIEEKKVIYSAVFLINLFWVGVYDLRSLYIILAVIIFYLIYLLVFINNYAIKKKTILLPVLSLFLLIFLNLYWVLPILSISALTSNENLGRLISFSDFYRLQHAITLHFPFWTNSIPKWEKFIPIPWYFWLYPVFAILGLVVNKKNLNIIFFAILAVIGILLTKQLHIPFDNLYEFLYKNLLGFNAFREASKFYFLIALGYSVLIGSLAAYVSTHWNKNKLQRFGKYNLITILFFLPIWNTIPYLTREIDSLFVPKRLPNDFKITKNFIFDQEDYFRTFWIHPSGRWVLSSVDHPLIDAEVVMKNNWSSFLPLQFNSREKKGKILLQNLKDKNTDKLLDLASTKYVMVLLDDYETGDYIAKAIGVSKKYVLNEMDKINYLRKINIGTQDILLYENFNFRPHFYTTYQIENINSEIPYKKVEYKRISSSEYEVILKGVSRPLYLHFTEAYHPEWVLRIGDFNILNTIIKKDYFLSNKYHFANIAGLNSFLIDSKFICKNNDVCKKNSDGNYDLKLTVFFKPQAYAYLGISLAIFSFVALFILIMIIISNKRISYDF
ncbi:MAG: hypothetical protein KatS3mg089_0409 [Patescibacteria group bacterium]|nr:MAG: hypothetical protein KatS3mg089_0409 [Patescibacteria group bacterium]